MKTKRINVAILLIIYLAIAIGIGLAIAKLNARLASTDRLHERRDLAALNSLRNRVLVNGKRTSLNQLGLVVTTNAVPLLTVDPKETLQTLGLDGVTLRLDTLKV